MASIAVVECNCLVSQKKINDVKMVLQRSQHTSAARPLPQRAERPLYHHRASPLGLLHFPGRLPAPFFSSRSFIPYRGALSLYINCLKQSLLPFFRRGNACAVSFGGSLLVLVG